MAVAPDVSPDERSDIRGANQFPGFASSSGYEAFADQPNSKPRLHAFIATADPRMKTICSSVRVEKNVRMWVM